MVRILISLAICFALANALPSTLKSLKALTPSEEYTHSLTVDEDEPEQYQLFWKLVDDDEFIQFEVH